MNIVNKNVKNVQQGKNLLSSRLFRRDNFVFFFKVSQIDNQIDKNF